MKNHPPQTQPKLSGLSAVAAATLLLTACAGNPPTEQMAVSKTAISNASSAGANEFAPLQLKTAMEKMDAANKAISDGDNDLALQLAEQAQVDAKLASMTARAAKALKATSALQDDNRVLRQEIERKTQ